MRLGSMPSRGAHFLFFADKVADSGSAAYPSFSFRGSFPKNLTAKVLRPFFPDS